MRSFRLTAVAIVLFFGCAPGAWAHARLLRAEPKNGADVSAAPKEIQLWFNELLEEGFNTVTVFPAKEAAEAKKSNFAKGKPVVDAKDKTHLTVKLETLAPGEYIVEWRVLSRDGHSAPGRSTFRVAAK
jgi:methionine-rich copper-binding protein CopC